MTTLANRRRAADARLTLNPNTIELDGLDVAIVDQLTNLMHLARHNNLNWDDIYSTSMSHFTTEQGEQE